MRVVLPSASRCSICSPVGLEHGELWIVLSGNAFVAEIAIDLENFVEPAHEQTLQIKLRRDAQIKIETERLVVRAKRFGGRASGDRLQNRRLHLQKTAFFKEAPRFADDGDAFFKDDARTLVGEKIEVTLPVARLDILQPMPFFGERPQSFRQQSEGVRLQSRFTALGEETCSFDANEIADIEQTKKIDQLRPNFFRVNVNLDAAGSVAQIEKVALPHVSVRGDAAGRAEGLAAGKFFAHLGNGSAWLETSTERVDTLRA